MVIGIATQPVMTSGDRLRIGQATIHRIADIERIGWPVSAIFRDLTSGDLVETEARYPGAVDAAASQLILSFSSYIIDMPGCLCLIDTGIGNDKERLDRPAWHQRNGDFMQRLKSLGYEPGQFDIVVNTHLHADHVGWNTTKSAQGWNPTFPNARYIVPASELAHWRRLYEADPSGHVLHGAFEDSVRPLLDARRYEAVDLPAQIAPGLSLEPAPGHTLGMAAVRLKTPDGDVLFSADVLHSPVQLKNPDVTSNFCVDPAQARATRHALLDGCARSNAILATYHFPPPVFGHIVKSGSGYLFEPVA